MDKAGSDELLPNDDSTTRLDLEEDALPVHHTNSANWTGVPIGYNPCSNAISNSVCINTVQLTIICLVCFTILLMIFIRILFCCSKRRRLQKRVPDILAMEDDMIRGTRFSAINSITGGTPPPRYSQIFDQDGISVFEEAPPEYETAQPDLLKSLPPVSRTSSLTSKAESNGNATKCPVKKSGWSTVSSVDESNKLCKEKSSCRAQYPIGGHDDGGSSVQCLSIDGLVRIRVGEDSKSIFIVDN